MPRNGSGVYGLPAAYLATTGTTITATQHNVPLTDIEADLNAARPIGAGGTGASTASAARTNLGAQEASSKLTAIAALTPTDGNVIQGDGSTWKSVAVAGIPTGGIIMWSGAVANIPDGWLLCDGTNSTPDLTDRFIVGAGGTYDPDDTGGEATHTLTTAELPSHSHSNGSLATASAGGHTHGLEIQDEFSTGLLCFRSNGTGADSGGAPDAVLDVSGHSATPVTGPLRAAGAHTHTVTGDTAAAGSGDAHENRPPYYALAFIMKS